MYAQQRKEKLNSDAYGLSPRYILQKRKESLLKSARASNLTVDKATLNNKKIDLGETNMSNIIDTQFMVVFAEDGSDLESCKSFKFNLKDLLTKYEEKNTDMPAYMQFKKKDEDSEKVKLGNS